MGVGDGIQPLPSSLRLRGFMSPMQVGMTAGGLPRRGDDGRGGRTGLVWDKSVARDDFDQRRVQPSAAVRERPEKDDETVKFRLPQKSLRTAFWESQHDNCAFKLCSAVAR